MEAAIAFSILAYLASTAGYITFFFLQKRRLQQIGFAALLVGFAVHTVGLVLTALAQGHFPAASMRETLSIAGWAIAGVFIALNARYPLKILGIYAAPLAALLMLLVSLLPDEPAQTTPIFKSVWLVTHVTMIFIGEAAFALAAGAGILYLIQENAIKTKRRRFFCRRLSGGCGATSRQETNDQTDCQELSERFHFFSPS